MPAILPSPFASAETPFPMWYRVVSNIDAAVPKETIAKPLAKFRMAVAGIEVISALVSSFTLFRNLCRSVKKLKSLSMSALPNVSSINLSTAGSISFIRFKNFASVLFDCIKRAASDTDAA